MIKLLLLALLGFVLYAFFLSLVRPSTGVKPKNKELTGEVMVEDPACGTFIPQDDALKARIKGQDYYFCSKKCLEEYNRQLNDTHSS